MKKHLAMLVILAAVFALAASVSEAAVSVTVKNNRSHNMSFAFCWQGFDMPDDMSKGWYNVKAGETRTITFKDVVYALTAQGFGYYATGTPKGGKKLTWAGKGGDELMEYYIHPKESFTGSRDEPIEGGQKVPFRKVKLKETGSDRTDGSATLTFNP